MAEAVPVRCPGCMRENSYTSPVFPCACGSPVVPPLDLTAPPEPLTHRTWSDAWVTVRCASCGRESEWPHPEVGCGSCGTVVRLAVHPLEQDEPERAGPGRAGPEREGREQPGPGPGPSGARSGSQQSGPSGAGPWTSGPSASGPSGPEQGEHGDDTDGLRDEPPAGTERGLPGEPAAGPARPPVRRSPRPGPVPPPSDPAVPRPPFRPVTIRTARDAVATAALYLRWLGFQDVRQPDGRPIPSAAVDLRAPGLVAQVDPTTAPAGLRAVECVWLNGLTASATSVYFSLAGYTEDARTRADDLGIPLFVMDLTGMPLPVNDPADALIGTGA